VDWGSVIKGMPDEEAGAFVYVDGAPINTLQETAYDPEHANMLLEEAAYDRHSPITLLYAADDPGLAEMAARVADGLGRIAMTVQVEAVPGGDLDKIFQARVGAGEGTLALIH
jgi:ABC-type transport system substrate-binding protein